MRKLGIQTEDVTLQAGDFYIPHLPLLIERKSIVDLQANFNHLPNQLVRCHEHCKNVMLLLEGHYSFDEQSGNMFRYERGERIPIGLTHKAVQNFLISLQLYHNTSYFMTNNLTDTVLFLRNLHELSEKPFHRILDFKNDHASRVMNMYASLPGVGEKHAKRIYDAFPKAPISTNFAERLRKAEIPGLDIEGIREFLRHDPSNVQGVIEDLTSSRKS